MSENKNDDAPEVTTDEARQGRKVPGMRLVLIAGIVLAVIALLGLAVTSG